MAHTAREIAHDDAVRALRAEYYSDIKTRAKDILSRIKAGEINNHNDLDEAIHEDTDGSEWVIYTHRSRQVLYVSENSDAYFDEGVGSGEDLASSDGIKWEVLAYYAMRRDLLEALDALGVDHRYKFGADEDGTEAEDGEEEAEG